MAFKSHNRSVTSFGKKPESNIFNLGGSQNSQPPSSAAVNTEAALDILKQVGVAVSYWNFIFEHWNVNFISFNVFSFDFLKHF